MAEIATIARPYSEALYKAVKAAATPDFQGASVWVDELAAIAANPQLQSFADNPKVTTAQVLDLIKGIAKTALPEQANNFLRTELKMAACKPCPKLQCNFAP